jgi:hypothetical protein
MINDLEFVVDVERLKTAVDLESLLKKYKRERSRKKMEPLYEKMVVGVANRVKPQMMFAVFGEAVVKQLQAHVLDETVNIVLAVCTLGPELDRYYDELSVDDLALAAIADEIGVAWVVNLTKQFHQSIRAQMSDSGLKVGPPFRPGVGNIPIEVQKVVFEQLETTQIGVTLSDYLVMTPIRSTSLMIPIYARS